MKKLEEKCEEFAKIALFGNGNTISEAMAKIGLQYRKGQTSLHVKAAIDKGVKKGMGNTEFEISMVASYLSKIFKDAK